MPKKPPAQPKPEQMLADAARISPQQIWQAGLGAFLKAQEEGDRAFARLVQDGSELQARERAAAAASDLSDASDNPAAATSWTRLEQMFEDRVARALAAMDVPTHRDLQELRERIDELTRQLGQPILKAPNKAAGKKAVPKKAAAKQAAPKKATPKKATPKKAAGKRA